MTEQTKREQAIEKIKQYMIDVYRLGEDYAHGFYTDEREERNKMTVRVNSLLNELESLGMCFKADNHPDLLKAKLSEAIQLCGDILQFAWHGDYANGNEAFGTDEGRVRARECLEEYESKFNKLRSPPKTVLSG